jgi:hypothetical protein
MLRLQGASLIYNISQSQLKTKGFKLTGDTSTNFNKYIEVNEVIGDISHITFYNPTGLTTINFHIIG